MQHEVEADWTAYFDTLLTTKDLSLAVEALNQINTRVPYAFFTSEQIFDKMAEILIKPYKERKFRRERLFKLLKKAKKTPAIVEQYTNEELMTYFKKYVSNQPRLMGYWKEYFLMQSDVTPIERL